MTPEKQKFYEQLKNAAIEQQIKYGVPASVTLAQAWIEHGTYSKTTNNYFGIHDDNGYWRKHGGKTVVLNDHGKMAHFRVYNSMEQGIEDHSRFFLVNQRYGKCLAISSTDADYGKKWAQGICNAGYAERPANDPNRYARIICAEIDEYKLDQIDRQANAIAAQRGLAVGYMRGNAHDPMQPAVGAAVMPGTEHSLAVDVTPTPADQVLLAQSQPDGQQMLSQMGNFNDPLQMLSFMMQQQNIQGTSQGFLSNIVSTLFTGCMALAMQLQCGAAQDMAQGQEEVEDVTLPPEQRHLEAVHRQRETPDAERARQQASMVFDADSPEQQQGQSVRLA